jgi:hypothetical protein
MMPSCAYQRPNPDIMCFQTIDWLLKSPQRSPQNAIVETQEEKKKMDLQYELLVRLIPIEFPPR